MGNAGGTRLHPVGLTATLLLRKLIPAVAIATAWALSARAAEPGTLTTLHAVHTLTKAEARLGPPVAFEATVTYYNKGDIDLFVQDGDEAIYVETQPGEDLAAGDRVLVRGKARDSFTPDVLSENITLLHHGLLPKPVTVGFEPLIRAQRDCMRVTVHATVRSAETVNFGNVQATYFTLLMDGGYIDASVVGIDASALKELLDAEVDVTGVVSGKFDSKMQLIGILLEVSTLADVKMVKRAPTSPDLLPMTPMDQVMSTSYVHDQTRRVRVQGTITYYQPGAGVVLEEGDRSLWISTHASNPMRVGDVATATGFPDARAGYLALTDGEVQDLNIYAPIQPQPSTWRQLATWNSGDPDGHQNDLVSFEGQLAASMREDSQDEFVLVSNGKLFTAVYRHPPGNKPLPPMKYVPLGAKVRVTGICMALQASTIQPSEQEVPFNILLRSFDDISVVTQPSLLNVRNLVLLVAMLLALLFAAAARAWVMERKVQRQKTRLAYIERQRSRILEDINGSRPLAEIVKEITELVCLRLRGARCWCQLADGAQLGKCPPKLIQLRILEEPIPARSGPPHGTIFAAFDPTAKPSAGETEMLTTAAALTALAIETRQLYSDLVHRSQFDLLTDIHNRFSLESYLDEQIDEARKNAGIFGLVYIDLNDFKQVNDVYGHQVGDLYLQEVAVRMKSQLRGGDMLARLGGDEFAVLLPRVHNHAEVKEIALRLERCLDTPFAAQGYAVHGSASVGIALYPEDGTTKDALLNAADAAMYVNKQTRRDSSGGPANHRGPELTAEDRG